MLPSQLVWYSGIAKDQESAKNGSDVVLSANTEICRVPSYENGKFMLNGYFTPEEVGILASTKGNNFSFAGNTYLTWPVYFYCSTSKEEKLKEWYGEFCERPKDSRIETFRQTWLRNRATMAGQCKTISKGNTINMPLAEVIDRIERLGAFEATFTICLVTQVGAVGTIDLFLRIEKSSGYLPYQVTYFDKSKAITDTIKVMDDYGLVIPVEDITSVIDNILLELSKVLRDSGIEFVTDEPDDLPF